ncbi:uncharacterized protein LOC129187250 [Dunckerocampus dactyliophorus]|uniref:uncharacterized protein LOC129187250 n=1 Tax=Dunckerocampus dactyliophorus TaxID=161453 RepID=UPI002404B607|nr:uncharacterized protein LOC129187250 [Dunckerocampus dactyliophorus]
MGLGVYVGTLLFWFHWTGAVWAEDIRVCAADNCTDYRLQFERVFTVPGDVGMLNCTLVSPDVFDFTATPYDVSWYRLEARRPLSNVSGRVVVLGETLWLLNVTLEDDGQYQCVVRTSSGCYKQSTKMVVERPADGECGRPRKAAQVLTIGVTDTLSCPLTDVIEKLDSYRVPSSVSWYKGCELIEDGSEGHVYRSKARLKIQDVDPQNNDTYTCTLTFTLGGVTASVSETIEAWVQEDYCFLPQVLKPANEIFKAPVGSRLTRACQVFVPCIGKLPEDPMVDIFWLADDTFVFSTNVSDRVSTSQQRVWTESGPSKGVWLERLLTIGHLKEEDFLINYTCRAYSGRGLPEGHFAVLPQEPSPIVPISCALSGVTALVIATAVVYFLFKIDIVLCFRMFFPVLYANEDCDGKLFDAYVTYPLNCEEDFSDEACTFALHILPQVLEKACGYKLFIAGRDSLPGQAMVDSVQDNMLASRRLLLLYSASSFMCSNNNNNNNISVCSDPRRQHECVTAMHRALLEGTLKVVLVELEEVSPAQLAVFPESLRHLRRKQGAVCWWKNQRTRRKSSFRTCVTTQDKEDMSPLLSPSSRFWKEMRYHMPVKGTGGAAPDRTALLKNRCPTNTRAMTATVALLAACARVLATLLFVAVTHGHKPALDTYHASAGHLLLLKCSIGDVHSNVTWTRGGANPALPPGVEVRDRLLWFLPVQASHNGTYSCETGDQSGQRRMDFGVFVSSGICPPVADVRRIPVGVTQSLPCMQEDVLRHNRTRNIRWLKDCRGVQREGAPVTVTERGFLRLPEATQEDAGKYTCLVEVRLRGRKYISARSIQLQISNETVLTVPQVVLAQEVIAVEVGARKELKCLALMGLQEDNEMSIFWTVDGSFIEDDEALQNSSSFSFLRRKGRVYGESNLTISRVLPRFLNVPISCRFKNALGEKDCVKLLVEAPRSCFRTSVALSTAASLLLLLLVTAALVFFKVDVTLAYRKLRGHFGQQGGHLTSQDAHSSQSTYKDGVLSTDRDVGLYDAFVSFLGAGELTSAHAARFALQTLPCELEEQHGYLLFITGRDDCPGEATHDAIAAIMRRCRRLIIIVFSGETEAQTRPLSDEQKQLSYEQQLGLHDALTHNQPRVILVEIDGPLDDSHLPESLRYIRRKYGALTWKTDVPGSQTWRKSNRLFWKKLSCLTRTILWVPSPPVCLYCAGRRQEGGDRGVVEVHESTEDMEH